MPHLGQVLAVGADPPAVAALGLGPPLPEHAGRRDETRTRSITSMTGWNRSMWLRTGMSNGVVVRS